MSQKKGRFEVYDFDGFRLHVYYTSDVMDDASYIVEGASSVVTMEHPLFKDNVSEFDAYVDALCKNVEKRIANYHIGGSHDHPIVMVEGMAAFSKGPVYGGMMRNFGQMFGSAMTELPTGSVSEVPFGSTQHWAGVDFVFEHGAVTDFPAAGILIGGCVYYTHWAPARMHMNHLQIPSVEAIDARIAELDKALASGAVLFIGGHGGAADVDTARFALQYLQTVKGLRAENISAESFVSAMRTAYPALAGEQNLEQLANVLYN